MPDENKEVVAQSNYIQESIDNVAKDPQFNSILHQIAQWSFTAKNIREIEPEQSEETKQLFVNVKESLKQFETLRKDAVFIHNNVVKMINDIFRPPKTELQKIKDHLSVLIGEYEKKLQDAMYEAEIESQNTEAVTVSDEIVNIAPVRTLTHDEVIKLQTREQIEVTIDNPEELLKAILSIQKRNKDFTLELISFNEPALRKLAKTKKSIPGCTITKAVRAQ